MKKTRDQSEGLQALAGRLWAILSGRACVYLKKAYSSRLGGRVAVTTTRSTEESQRSPLSPGPQAHFGHGVNVSLSAEGALCRGSPLQARRYVTALPCALSPPTRSLRGSYCAHHPSGGDTQGSCDPTLDWPLHLSERW